MTVAQPASPANYFHLLRWHMKNPARRPLIVFTPKSMLRLKAAASALSDFTSGDRVLRRISRRATASPATGSHHLHEDEQKALLLEAFTR